MQVRLGSRDARMLRKDGCTEGTLPNPDVWTVQHPSQWDEEFVRTSHNA